MCLLVLSTGLAKLSLNIFALLIKYMQIMLGTCMFFFITEQPTTTDEPTTTDVPTTTVAERCEWTTVDSWRIAT